jgi:hypothetical protein
MKLSTEMQGGHPEKELMKLVLCLGGRPASLYAMEPANFMLNLGR